MKNKKGFIALGIMPLIYLGLVSVILIMLIFFGFQIKDGLLALIDFFKDYGLYILIVSLLLLFAPQVRAIANVILRKVGVKV